jgi:uncharacterized membrane protein
MQLLLIFQYPLVAHLAVLLGEEWIKLIALVLLVVGIQFQALLALRTAALISTALLVLALIAVWYLGFITWLLYLTPTLIPVVLFFVFGSTLRPGREALITAIGEKARGPLSAAMRSYTRKLTWLWTLMFVVLAIESLLVLLYGSDGLCSWLINIMNPALIGIVFIAEFFYRKQRFPLHAHPTFREYLDIVRSRPP